MPTGRSWRLSHLEDLRPIDFATGSVMPFHAAEVPCSFCGRVHDVVWHVRSPTGERLVLGEECIPKACEGWTPSAEDRQRAELQLAKDREKERALEVTVRASNLVDKVTERLQRGEIRGPIEDVAGWARETVLAHDAHAKDEGFWAEIRRRAERTLVANVAKGKLRAV